MRLDITYRLIEKVYELGGGIGDWRRRGKMIRIRNDKMKNT